MIGTSQQDWVRAQLKKNGKVTRNDALKTYISRLGAIICDLKKMGWEIEGQWVTTATGKDYVYTLASSPKKRVSTVEVVDGRAIETFIEV